MPSCPSSIQPSKTSSPNTTAKECANKFVPMALPKHLASDAVVDGLGASAVSVGVVLCAAFSPVVQL
jgi:hypothetical protein